MQSTVKSVFIKLAVILCDGSFNVVRLLIQISVIDSGIHIEVSSACSKHCYSWLKKNS